MSSRASVSAARPPTHGTAILYATPHVWPHLTLTEERERTIRANFAHVAEQAELELRLGFELTPAPPLLEQDLSRYVLDGTNAVLIEVPFTGSEKLLVEICERHGDAGPAAGHRAPRAHAVGARAAVARARARGARLAAAGERQLADRAARPGDRGARVGARRRRARFARRVQTGTAARARQRSTTPTPRSSRAWGRRRLGRSSTGRRSEQQQPPP